MHEVVHSVLYALTESLNARKVLIWPVAPIAIGRLKFGIFDEFNTVESKLVELQVGHEA